MIEKWLFCRRNRARNLSKSATLKMTKKSRELKLQGKNIINLGTGKPDFNTPDNKKNTDFQAIASKTFEKKLKKRE